MKKNDIIELVIEDMGVDGAGIGKYQGMTFFVKDAVVGDCIKARVTKLKKNYGYARVEEIVTPSVHRVEPECALHKRCGGCQIQALAYEEQLQFKQRKVRADLIRIGGFAEELVDAVMLPIVGMERPYRYRNKAQFPIGRDKDGSIVAGFFASRTHNIIPVEDCHLGVGQNREVLGCVIAYMRENRIEPYDEGTERGLVRHVLIRYGFTTEEIMVCLVINGKRLPAQEKLIEELGKIEGMTSISINQNTKKTNVILGDVTETIWGLPYITDYIHLRECGDVAERKESSVEQISDMGAKEALGTDEKQEFALTDTAIAYRISPQSFYQVNPGQTEKLYSLALSYAGLTGEETVWDLYCGIGTISLFLAQRAGKVYGVEVVPQAIKDARSNAELNGITNVEFFVGKAEEVLPEFYESVRGEKSGGADMLHPDVIVVDPPRKGCDERCLETMLQMRPERIVYVSCDPATLARDLKVLCEGGYELRKVRAVDQFGHTVHVETVVLLSKGEVDSKKIRVEFSLEDMDMSEFQDGATYTQIKDYVLEHSGLKVSNLYISQIKRKCGIEVGKNYNLPKSEDSRQPQCPPEKEKAIREAMKYFGMI